VPKRFSQHVWRKPTIRHNRDTKWGWRVAHPRGLTLGKEVDIGYGTYIQAEDGVQIGDRVQIGGHCRLYSVDTERDIRSPISIGTNARIGSGCTILPGVHIPDGYALAAHSVALVKGGRTVFKTPIYREVAP